MSVPIDLPTLQLSRVYDGSLPSGSGTHAVRLSDSDRAQPSFREVLRGCLEQAVAGNEAAQPTAFVGGNVGVSDGVAGHRQASVELVNFVAAHEGYSATAYRGADVQNRTIGYGHVLQAGESAVPLSRSGALTLLKDDLSDSVASVNLEFSGVNLSQSQFDALVSFSFNLGSHIWDRAPKLTADIKAGASAETLRRDFVQFDHCNGRELTGLYNRRVDEWNMFVNGQYLTDI